jgi:hypothetical protein
MKEVAALKEDHEKELQSLAVKYSQDIAALEGQMTSQTTQHEVYCECCSVTCYPEFLFSAFIFLHFSYRLSLLESHKMNTLMASHFFIFACIFYIQNCLIYVWHSSL